LSPVLLDSWKNLTIRTDRQNDRMKELGTRLNRHLAHGAFLIWTQTNDRDKTTVIAGMSIYCSSQKVKRAV
jgi:hypothetical protein